MDTLEGGPGSGVVAELAGERVGVLTWFVGGDESSADGAAGADGAAAADGAAGADGAPAADGIAAGGSIAEVRALVVADDRRGQGIGRALLLAAEAALREVGVARAWLVTTNDNLAALALYQKAGWRLSTLRPGAVEAARATLKPSIPELGEHGIPVRDELELRQDL